MEIYWLHSLQVARYDRVLSALGATVGSEGFWMWSCLCRGKGAERHLRPSFGILISIFSGALGPVDVCRVLFVLVFCL